jgi:hypothetical protein
VVGVPEITQVALSDSPVGKVGLTAQLLNVPMVTTGVIVTAIPSPIEVVDGEYEKAVGKGG